MRIAVFSDVHGEMGLLGDLIRRMPELDCDAGLFCGDTVKGDARRTEYMTARSEGRLPDPNHPAIEAERAEDYALYAEFYALIRTAPFRIFAVPGNMDAPEGRYIATGLGGDGAGSGIEIVHHSVANHGGWVIAGMGGEITEADREEFFVLRYPRWEAEHAFRVFSCVQGGRIMMLHTPPVGEVVDINDGRHLGCQVVNDLIHHWRPALAVCGHAHGGFGSEMLGSTLVVNPGALKEGRFATVDMKTKEVQLLEL